MFKVIIADDEKIVRIAMQSIINWEEHNFKIVGIVQDGQEVIDILDEKEPDLIITDLKMSKVNGLQLIDYLNNINYKGKVIVLSNHGDYELVREAMKKGAMDYLLKVTLKSTELSEVINNVSLSLKRNYENEKKSESLKEEYNRNKNVAKISILKEHLQEELSYEEFRKSISKYDIKIFNEKCTLMYFIIDDYKKVYENHIKDKSKMISSMTSIIKESLFNKSYEIIQMNSYSCIVIINESKDMARILARNIQKSINLYMNFSISMVISSSFKGSENLKSIYLKCNEIMKYKFYDEKAFTIDEDVFNGFSDLSNIHREVANNIKINLDNGNIHENIQVILDFINKCKEINAHPDKVIKLAYFFIELIEKYEFSNEILEIEDLTNIKKSINKCLSINDLKARCENALNIINDICVYNRDGNIKKEILDVIEFINKNIDKRITLMMVSQSINMNESYLSRLFKNETGKNLMYFINEIKMEKARELLKRPNALVKEVAIKVGMSDQFYFNRVFKKFYGISPSQFKKQYDTNFLAK